MCKYNNVLRCVCGALEFAEEVGLLKCLSCGHAYSLQDGILDVIPEYSGSSLPSQWAMENPLVVSVYERFVRPAVTKIFSGGSMGYSKEEAWLSALLPDSVPVLLDLACGSGRYAAHVSKLKSPDLIVSVDLSLPMLREAKRKNEELGITNVIYVRADAAKLPLADNVIDFTTCFGALHLFSKPGASLGEVGRVSKSGAMIVGLTAGAPEGRDLTIQRKLTGWTFFDRSTLSRLFDAASLNLQEYNLAGLVLLFAGYAR